MSDIRTRVDFLRGLKNSLPDRLSDSCNHDRKKKKKKKNKKEINETFGDWFRDVLSEVSGLESDEMMNVSDTAWSRYYKRGILARDAVALAMDDGDGFEENDAEISKSLRKRRTESGGADYFSNLEKLSNLERLLDDEIDDDFDGDQDCIEVYEDENEKAKDVSRFSDMDIFKKISDEIRNSDFEENKIEEDFRTTKNSDFQEKKGKDFVRESESEMILRGIHAVREEGPIPETKLNLPGNMSSGIKEASVLGGDWGRWGPATSAVSGYEKSLGQAISAKMDDQYVFSGDGKPSSADGGSELWFGFFPKISKNPNYYLCVKLKDSKNGDDQHWDVKLTKGQGISSSSVVSSVNGVKTSELPDAVRSLKDRI